MDGAINMIFTGYYWHRASDLVTDEAHSHCGQLLFLNPPISNIVFEVMQTDCKPGEGSAEKCPQKTMSNENQHSRSALWFHEQSLSFFNSSHDRQGVIYVAN